MWIPAEVIASHFPDPEPERPVLVCVRDPKTGEVTDLATQTTREWLTDVYQSGADGWRFVSDMREGKRPYACVLDQEAFNTQIAQLAEEAPQLFECVVWGY